MNRTIGVVVVMLFSIAWHPAAMRAQSAPEVTLRAALELEQIKGDLKGAIELYKKVVDGADRAAGAKALLRMAECYQNLGDKKANKAYERLVRDFGDQREAAVARTRLREPAAMSKGDRAVWTGQHVDLFGTISPDGRYLTYIDWESTGNLMVRDLVANTDRALTNNVKHSQFGGADWSSISRDGTQVAYSWWHAGGPPQFEVRVAPLMGSGIPASRVIWRGSGRDSMRPFDWSPDGRSLLVLVEREDRTSQLGIVNVAAGTVQVLKSLNWRGISKAVFSADGRHIAYDVEAGDGSRHSSVFIMAVDASRDLAAVAGPTRNNVMGWSADGRHLLFASDRSGTLGLWALPTSGGRPAGAPSMVRSELASTWSLGLTPAGTLYVWKRASAAVVKIVSANLQTGELTHGEPVFQRFIESRGRPRFSDDGKELLFMSCGPSGGGPCTLSIYSSETDTVRGVTHSLGYLQVPRLSPDGRMIAANGTDIKGRRGIYLIDLQTNETSVMVTDDGMNRPALFDWTADSSSIVYAVARDKERLLIQRAVRGGAEKDLISVPQQCTGTRRISPDRKMYGCQVADDSGKANGILVAPLDGSTPRIAFKAKAGEDFSGMWMWAPDSRSVVLKKQLGDSKEELWMVPFDRAPVRLALDTDNWVDPNFDIHPDGRHLVFTASAGAPGAEVWALENLLPVTNAKR